MPLSSHSLTPPGSVQEGGFGSFLICLTCDAPWLRAEGLSGYGNSQLLEEFGSAERDGVLIDMPEDSDAWRFLYSAERQELPGQPAIGRIVRKAS